MVIGWICSLDLFETSWEGLHDVLPIVIAEESRMFIVNLNHSCRIRTYTPDVGDHELF